MPTVPVPASVLRRTGGCLQPVLLRGRADYIDGGTGELIHRYTTVHEPGGVLPIACKTRRASHCPSCAETYRADTYQLIRAGLTGGKRVPATVADHPCVFATLTAPSFGPVHSRREKDGRVLRCRPRRASRTCPHGISMSCTEKHAPDDDQLGEPLCPECYDYTGSVLFNACAPELWRRFTITLSGRWPARLGLPTRRSPRRSGSLTPRSPNTSGAGSSISTPSSASTALQDQQPPHPPGRRSVCSQPPSARPSASSAS